jgi:NAD(P)-dependent dehydrogenase (short-subunit alcohol dehydrogenase family)
MTTGPLAGRVALVTGGGRGIGRAHALALAADGAAVMVNDLGTTLEGRGRDATPAEALAAAIRSSGAEARADTTDVASVDGGRRAVARTIEAFGRIDILVNNAGFAHGGGTVEEPVEHEIDALLDVHLKAALGTMAAAFADMRRRGWGRIVNTVSEASLDPRFVGSVGYAAAKAALWAATLAAAAEGFPHGITVNAISPGARTRMNAELIDAGFRDGSSSALDLDPAHVGAVVAYLVSDAATDITGRIVHAAGGELREYTTTRSARTPLVERLLAAGVGSVGRRHAERPHHEFGGSGDDTVDVGRVDLGQ